MKLRLHTKGSPELAQVAEPVAQGEDVGPLLAEMWRVLKAAGGIGLTANQVGVLKRVLIMNVNGLRLEFVNPVITLRQGGKASSQEGCLSFPGERVLLVRDRRVTIEGFNRKWEPIRRGLKDLGAFCAQHEMDHLDGRTIA